MIKEAAKEAAKEAEGTRRTMDDRGKLRDEVRQSLSLILMTALTLLASIAFGLLVGHVG